MTKAPDVVETFHHAAAEIGFPASVLTDNGAIFTAEARNGASAFELELLALGIEIKHSRPYHPQTCGKVCECEDRVVAASAGLTLAKV